MTAAIYIKLIIFFISLLTALFVMLYEKTPDKKIVFDELLGWHANEYLRYPDEKGIKPILHRPAVIQIFQDGQVKKIVPYVDSDGNPDLKVERIN